MSRKAGWLFHFVCSDVGSIQTWVGIQTLMVSCLRPYNLVGQVATMYLRNSLFKSRVAPRFCDPQYILSTAPSQSVAYSFIFTWTIPFCNSNMHSYSDKNLETSYIFLGSNNVENALQRAFAKAVLLFLCSYLPFFIKDECIYYENITVLKLLRIYP